MACNIQVVDYNSNYTLDNCDEGVTTPIIESNTLRV